MAPAKSGTTGLINHPDKLCWDIAVIGHRHIVSCSGLRQCRSCRYRRCSVLVPRMNTEVFGDEMGMR